MLEAVIFDIDGTVIPTLERQEAWFRFYSEKNGKEWQFQDFEQFREFYNRLTGMQGGVQNVYDELELPCDMKDHSHPVWPAYVEFNQSHPSKLYPGMKEVIKQVWEMGRLSKDRSRCRRVRLGINTTNSWKSIHGDLEKARVLSYFDARITAETLNEYQGMGNGEPLKKPSPVSLALMLGLLDSEAGLTLHVGDTLNDLVSSQKVIRLNPAKPEKLITVGACYGYEGRQVLERGVETDTGIVHFDHLIDEPLELVAVVQKYL